VLGPDNVERALRSGHGLGFDHEALRMIAASLLGASATPLILRLTRRYPVLGPSRWRHATLHAAAAAGLAFIFIVASCFLASWSFERHWLPSLAEIQAQLVSNWLLLVYAIAALSALAHAVRYFRQIAAPVNRTASANRLAQIPVKLRGRLTHLNPAEIDWIETQGNYLAMHAGAATHLIRETLLNFEAQLDANHFVRIHRRMIVAVDRIAGIQPAPNGDAILLS
jgi:hypothetical protein